MGEELKFTNLTFNGQPVEGCFDNIPEVHFDYEQFPREPINCFFPEPIEFCCSVIDPVQTRKLRILAGDEFPSNNWLKMHGLPMRRGNYNKFEKKKNLFYKAMKNIIDVLAEANARAWEAENGK